ncbi:MAG: hypothetical protein A3F09_02810 [Chlamydiae bacterium RIFCSPHIGHO2_12_FULL_49_11]|nr:MAG: hypothetical protein A3F09_02810 [Chlamydiae bacterium RIFCSPHIGHO2_12_FULL_49_11]
MPFWILFPVLLLCGERISDIVQLTFPGMGFSRAGEPYFSPDGLTVAFQATLFGEESYQIYVMGLAELIPRRISTGSGTCTCAYFRPDGKKIIFASSHSAPEAASLSPSSVTNGRYKWHFTPYMNIYESNSDGSEMRPLTRGAAYSAECSYAPDGTKIVFASNRDGNMHIYVMDGDGGHVRRLTRKEGVYHGGPFFSPDGTKIVFRADYDAPDRLQLYIMDADGSNLEKLFDDPYINWAPTWHPRGNHIIYTTSRHGHDRYELYLLDLCTRQQYRVTDSPGFDGLASFSRDGTKLVWTSKRSSGASHIYLATIEVPP